MQDKIFAEVKKKKKKKHIVVHKAQNSSSFTSSLSCR